VFEPPTPHPQRQGLGTAGGAHATPHPQAQRWRPEPVRNGTRKPDVLLSNFTFSSDVPRRVDVVVIPRRSRRAAVRSEVWIGDAELGKNMQHATCNGTAAHGVPRSTVGWPAWACAVPVACTLVRSRATRRGTCGAHTGRSCGSTPLRRVPI